MKVLIVEDEIMAQKSLIRVLSQNFPDMDIYAKSGTAQVGTDAPDAWFVGFTDDSDAPYAFVVWVKGGGYGSEAAAPIARTVIQQLKEDDQ